MARPFRRVFNLDALQRSAPLSLGGLALAILLPGFSFFALGRKLFGWICLAAYVVLAAVFVVWLGFPYSAWAYGLMLSVHATSIVYVQNRWLTETGFAARAGLALCTLFALWALLYAPVAGYARQHWCVPVRIGDRVWVVRPGVKARSLQRGDWVLYEMPKRTAEGVFFYQGQGLSRVLGLPGDEVRFTRAAVVVNGKPFPQGEYMPATGGFIVPENVWFVWPEVSIRVGARAQGAAISSVMQEAAMVEPKQILGRPYKTWFGRNQWL